MAFDLNREPVARRRYGDHGMGQEADLARRLAESGVPFTLVNFALNQIKGQDWDTHEDNFRLMKNTLLPPMDRAVSSLLDDLRDRGLMDTTLVAILSEFGRTPRINANAGRDYWPNVFSVLLAGGGLKSGIVLGSSTRRRRAEGPSRPYLRRARHDLPPARHRYPHHLPRRRRPTVAHHAGRQTNPGIAVKVSPSSRLLALAALVLGGAFWVGPAFNADSSEASAALPRPETREWKKHVVHARGHNTTAVAADFTGDGKVNVICHFGDKVRLYVAPDWKEIVIRRHPASIPSTASSWTSTVTAGPISSCPATHRDSCSGWNARPIQRAIPGRCTSSTTKLTAFTACSSATWTATASPTSSPTVPRRVAHSRARPRGTRSRAVPRQRWQRHVFAQGDAPDNSHYFGLGDVNGDGRPDIALAAKGVPVNAPNANGWFAWWDNRHLSKPWKKHLIAANQPGATNILPLDVATATARSTSWPAGATTAASTGLRPPTGRCTSSIRR